MAIQPVSAAGMNERERQDGGRVEEDGRVRKEDYQLGEGDPSFP